jgi:polyhydroxyalkanoate synthesis regulator phasin
MTIEHKIIPVDDRTSNRDSTPGNRDMQADTQPDMTAARNRAAMADRDDDDAMHAELGTPYVTEQTSTQTSEQWQRVQADFVNDPRKSVAEAHKLVSDLVQRIVDGFTKERGDLERQWSEGDQVSTEDLRICLQRYRAFFSRLLPSAKGLAADSRGRISRPGMMSSATK